MPEPTTCGDPPEPTPVLRCGRRVFTTAHVAEIQCLLTDHQDWPRAHVAVALCRAWDWRHPDGTLKQQPRRARRPPRGAGGARGLPPPRRVRGPRRRPVPLVAPLAPLPADAALADLVVRPVTAPERTRWRQLMQTYHYLGCAQRVGESVEDVATIGAQ